MDDLNFAKNNLKKVLGASYGSYLKLLRKWFCQNKTKHEFDAEARLLFIPEMVRYHNDFLAALLNKCHIKQTIKRPNSPTPTGFKALKRIKRSASVSANLNHEKSFQNMSFLNPFNVLDASSALAAAHSNNVAPALCSKEGVLPDPSMIHGRLLIICWENDLEDVEDLALPLVIYALRDVLKNLIHACVELRRNHVVHDGRFQHLFGVEQCVSKNFSVPNVRHRVVGETMELKQSGIVATAFSRPRSKITLFDLYQALKIRPNLIPSHSLYSCLLERILCSLKGFQNGERKSLNGFAL